MNRPIDVLHRYWNYPSFRDLQEEIINSVLAKNDTIALLPTGGGKSMCYQIPALLNQGICVVVSPLISLMKDQIENLDKKGIKALSIPSRVSIDEIVALFDHLKYGKVKFLYLSPERLHSEIIIQKLKELHIGLIAVDEAHCISEWGHDFRPSYRKIKSLRILFPETNIIALTATATKKVIEDIKENLEMKTANIFQKSFFRNNLAHQIFYKENKLQTLEQIFYKNRFPTIVYVNSRQKTESLSNYFTDKGFDTVAYHGGMSAEDKLAHFESWMSEKTPIMIATNAFGMGIDKANVRVVVHLDLPGSIENYVQEAGRAGRDGKKSFSVVLQNHSDIDAYERKTLEKIPSLQEIKEVHKQLYQYYDIAKGEYTDKVFSFNFQDFCDRYQLTSKKTSTTLQILKSNRIIELNDTFYKGSTLQFSVTSKQLQNFKTKNQSILILIELLLRSYGGIFQKETRINEFDLARKLSTTSHKLKKLLRKLHKSNVILYHEHSTNQELKFLVPREDNLTINRHSKVIQSYLKQQIFKAKKLISFILNNEVCRSQQLLDYFGEQNTDPCGICDVCLSRKSSQLPDYSHMIIDLLKEKNSLSQLEIIQLLKVNEEAILIHLRSLLSEDKIGLKNNNKLYLK